MSLRHTLLALLDWVPLHGYALREFAKGYSWLHPMTNANIYPALRQLEEEGFVRHREEVHEGRLRKIYETTDAGAAELRRWLGDPTALQGTYRDPTLLKICFLREGALAPSRIWLREQLQGAQAVVDESERWIKDQGDVLPKYTRLVVEHGIALARLRTQWLAEVLEEVEREPECSAPPS